MDSGKYFIRNKSLPAVAIPAVFEAAGELIESRQDFPDFARGIH